MAKKPVIPMPPMPGDGDDSDGKKAKLSKKEKKRMAREEERKEARAQKAKLENIRREMRSRESSKAPLLWGIAAIVVVGAIVIGIYAFWCFHSTNLYRKSFMEHYQVADLAMIRRFAPEALAEVDKLKQAAEKGTTTMDGAEIRKCYRDAKEFLERAQEKALSEQTHYKEKLELFSQLEQEAQERKIPQYAPSIWRQVRRLRESAGDETDSEFSSLQAMAKLNEAVEILEETKSHYDAIRDYDAAYSEFSEMKALVVDAEWSRISPDKRATLRGMLTKAEAAAESNQWETATATYREAIEFIGPAVQELKGQREAAAVAVTALEEALAKVEHRERISAFDNEAWKSIVVSHERTTEAMRNYNYQVAETSAKQGLEAFNQLVSRFAESNEDRSRKLAALRGKYAVAERFNDFFRANMEQQWESLQTRYGELSERAETEHVAQVTSLAGKLIEEIEGLLNGRKQLIADTAAAEARLGKMLKDPAYSVIEVNDPKVFADVARSRKEGERQEARGKLADALKLYTAACESLESTSGELSGLKDESARLSVDCEERHEKFIRGVDAFQSNDRKRINSLRTAGRNAIKTENYRRAVLAYRELDSLLPDERFTLGEGTVADNRRGLMWVRDAGGRACKEGEAVDWYTALKWSNELVFGGWDDWRLPTDGELSVLSLLPAEQVQEIFRDTSDSDFYWSSAASQDAAKALGVNVVNGRTAILPKSSKHLIWPVRSPRQ